MEQKEHTKDPLNPPTLCPHDVQVIFDRYLLSSMSSQKSYHAALTIGSLPSRSQLLTLHLQLKSRVTDSFPLQVTLNAAMTLKRILTSKQPLIQNLHFFLPSFFTDAYPPILTIQQTNNQLPLPSLIFYPLISLSPFHESQREIQLPAIGKLGTICCHSLLCFDSPLFSRPPNPA